MQSYFWKICIVFLMYSIKWYCTFLTKKLTENQSATGNIYLEGWAECPGAGYLSYQTALSEFLGQETQVNLLYAGTVWWLTNSCHAWTVEWICSVWIQGCVIHPFSFIFLVISQGPLFFILTSVISELGWEFCQRPHWNSDPDIFLHKNKP